MQKVSKATFEKKNVPGQLFSPCCHINIKSSSVCLLKKKKGKEISLPINVVVKKAPGFKLFHMVRINTTSRFKLFHKLRINITSNP